MKRSLFKELTNWKNRTNRLPLIIRGARQVGKSYLIDQFGKKCFESYLFINLERNPALKSCFNDLDPRAILNRIYITTGKEIIPGKHLLVIDEIQESPKALQALRYFKEELPDLHIIAAGSLLEFALKETELSLPVGRVEFLYLKPLSFKEFLQSKNQNGLLEYLRQYSLKDQFDIVIHQQALKLLREYSIIGGMPAVVEEYNTSGNLAEVQRKQVALMQLYRQDFGKYAKITRHHHMQRILEQMPTMIGQNFKYSKVNPDVNSREIKEAANYLNQAGLLHKVFLCSAAGLPLTGSLNPRIYKVLMHDVGLCYSMSYIDPEVLLEKDIDLINKGMLAEQLVGQELIANQLPFIEPQLLYWERKKTGSTAEVDYVINIDEKIIPIEVKAGASGRLKSIYQFLKEKPAEFGIQLSTAPLSNEKSILKIPLYMIHELKRLVFELG